MFCVRKHAWKHTTVRLCGYSDSTLPNDSHVIIDSNVIMGLQLRSLLITVAYVIHFTTTWPE